MARSRALEASLLALVCAAHAGCAESGADTPPVKAETTPGYRLSALGRIEGRGETVNVGAALAGTIANVSVKPGDLVKPGQVLASLDCADLAAERDVRSAEEEASRQARERLLAGSRSEEKDAARERAEAQRAIHANALDLHRRNIALAEKGFVSATQLDASAHEVARSAALLSAARAEVRLAGAGPTPEEARKAEAELVAAMARRRLAGERMRKCEIRAPSQATVLKVHVRSGESVSVGSVVASLADVGETRVRAEVDERDLARVSLGQKVVVTADAHPGRQWSGEVMQILPLVTRKRVTNDVPTEFTDREVVEVVAGVGRGEVALPVGLRVTVRFH